MRHSRPVFVCLTVLGVALLAGLPGLARGGPIGSGVLDPVEASLGDLIGVLSAQDPSKEVKRDLRRAQSLRNTLLKKKTTKSPAHEAAAGAKVAKKALGFSASDEEIREVVTATEDAQAAHDTMVGTALFAIDLLLAQDIPAKNPAKERKRLQKRRDKIAKFDALADAATDTPKAYKWTMKALRAAGGYAGDSGESSTYVISSLTVGSDGLDLNGDGSPDNALSGLLDIAATAVPGFDMDQVLADQLGAGGTVTLLEIWAVDSFPDDPFAWFGLIQGLDTDGDPADNFLGTETFTYALGLGPDDHPAARTAAAIRKQRFDVSFSGADQEIGGLPIPALGRIRVAGLIEETGLTGTIGLALPVDAFLALVEAVTGDAVPLAIAGIIRFTADIDLDGDGTDDALSLAFDFESVPATAVAP